ncbi:neuropeptide FF receptor 1-like [Branchiostoma floridae]|uniref:Neuropeptide FF receptor 1-like n=1 Tax=Branchiostoma floridae TaxID=7739 RepID=A0A9J7MIG1_BRAFL|nr:neuropeptide FF receptor 1-like [Branchiostoma floridae]XP_035668465.1 neuropeptide FF receptor 1-like [Branchiostoma floridae]
MEGGMSPNISDLNYHNVTWNDERFIFDKYKQSTAVIVIFILAYLSIFLLCVVGNILVILVMVFNRNMRTVTNMFITNLAVADLLVGVFCLPFNLADNITTSWPFDDVMCKTFLTVQVLSVSASVFTLIAIAVDRYYAVVHPTSSGVTKPAMRYILVSVWLVAVCTCVPQGLVLTSTTYQDVYTSDGQLMTTCEEVWPGDHYRAAYALGLFITSYLTPLFIIAVLYIRISMRLWYRPKLGGNQTNSALSVKSTEPFVSYSSRSDNATLHMPTAAPSPSVQAQMSKKLHVIRMLLIVVVVFFLSWLPIHVFNIVSVFANLTENTLIILYHYVFPIVQCMAFINCGINPIIYGYYNKNLRKAFYQLIRKSS